MTINPLVVPRIDQPSELWAGVWIVEDLELIVQGVQSGSWVDTSIGSISGALDGLAFVADPFSGLLQYFAAALMEHFEPLREALDWLAGDPGQIAGHAQSWRNVSASLAAQYSDLGSFVNTDIANWSGESGTAYRTWSQLQHSAVDGLAKAAEAMAVITEQAGMVVATVRVMVRDLIAIAFSRAVTYITEEVFSFGLATPVVAAQLSTLVLACGARITRLLHGVVSSLTRLLDTATRLSRHIDDLTRTLSRLHEHPRQGLTTAHEASPPKIGGPAEFDPQQLKGLTPGDVAVRIPDDWADRPSARGGGTVYSDPIHPGRQIRVMPGYPPGSRPDPITWGPYVEVSQNGTRIKVPLAGNPTLESP